MPLYVGLFCVLVRKEICIAINKKKKNRSQTVSSDKK